MRRFLRAAVGTGVACLSMGGSAGRVGLSVVGGWLFDVAVAGVCTYFALLLTSEWMAGADAGQRGPALVLAAAHGAVLVGRRHRPAAVLVVVIGTGLAFAPLGLPVFVLGPAVLVALYTFAVLRDRRWSLAGLTAVELAVLVAATTGGLQWDSWLLYALLVGGSWLLGFGMRHWQLTAREAAERADQLARAREELAGLAVTQERVRIARELHDMVAHSMSVIAVQAATGRLVLERDPARAGEALSEIEVASRSALDEMRQLLTVLRDGGSSTGRDPTPALADLHDLVARMTKAGLTVEVHVGGDVADVPAGVGLACYRIVQEGLTNALRHAGQTHVTVTVTCGSDAVDVEVRDRGGSAHADRVGGQGMIGMRERAALYGGSCVAGPDPDGGWSVRAHVPYHARPPVVSA